MKLRDGSGYFHAEGEALVGALCWGANPAYRPLIGVFCAGKLVATAPTYRVIPDDGEEHWPCAFRLAAPALEGGEPTLYCLETGEQVLAQDPPPPASDFARPMLAEPDGFAAFLHLPCRDQLELVYLDVLGRLIDGDGLATCLEELATGREDVLSIRDKLLHSEEFAAVRRLAPGRAALKYLSWRALASLDGRRFPRADGVLALESSLFAAAGRRPPAETLAAIAVGPHVGPATRAAWVEAHADWIAERFGDAIALRRRSGVSAAQAGMRIGGLIADMRPGRLAGRPGKAPAPHAIVLASPRGGEVAHGPYLDLAPGRYRLALGLEIAEAAAGALSIEVCYKHLTLARLDARGEALRAGEFAVPFEIPASCAVLFHEPLIEARVYWTGAARLTLREVTLDCLPPSAEGAAAPIDWLPAMSRVEGVAFAPDGLTLLLPAAREGHCVYGPYRALAPGFYELACEVEVLATSPGKALTIEVGAPDGATLAFRRLSARLGRHRIALAFEVADEGGRELPPPLEFRLGKDFDVEAKVAGIATRAT